MFILFNGWLALSTSYTAPLGLYTLNHKKRDILF